MSRTTTEAAFEATIVSHLISQGGWEAAESGGFDPEVALVPQSAITFLRNAQGPLWSTLEKHHGASLPDKVLTALQKELALKGSLHVLRHGFSFFGKTLRMAIFKPAHALNPEVIAAYQSNILQVIRQAKCHPGKGDSVDLLLVVNGIPVATAELKNEMTGQNVQHAVKQYRTDRDPTAPLFAFTKDDHPARSIVHFAVDTSQVRMTSRLHGAKTHFLPLNRGSNPGKVGCGEGNPPHPSGYRTAYLWEEILQRDQFLEILGSYVFVETQERYRIDPKTKAKKRHLTRRLIFPRYHQLDAVRLLVGQARQDGAGHSYLIQHSAGSGKTNSIAWLSHRLASLHSNDDHKVFNCVIVITDRRVLDKQLQDAIYQIEHKQGVVQPIDQDSGQLATALVDGTQIIITTLQKFPFVIDRLAKDSEDEDPDTAKEWAEKIASRRYALIIDEAHSSQTGDGASQMRQVLSQANRAAEAGIAYDAQPDGEDAINAMVEGRGRRPNLSFFAFTATPKGKTLQLFGRKDSEGAYWPCHLYSMRQAIEERFILDVLTNYTTYKSFYKIAKSIADDPDVPKRKAASALARFMSLHPHNIEQKTIIMVEHFRNSIAHKLDGRAKAMVVTSSRLHAVRYMRAFQAYITKQGYDDIRPMVAFSGSVRDKQTGQDYTEPGMNTDPTTGKSIGEKELPEKFDSDDFQVLLVANKYQTGFDQPLLYAMYVDRPLKGVQAVQTLSRLNRSYHGKTEPVVLDFVNETVDILAAFQPYYEVTSLDEPATPDQLEALKHELDGMQIYHWAEVEAFAAVFFKSKQHHSDHGHLNKHLTPAVDRFKGVEAKEDREAFRDKLSAFVKLYAFLGQLMPWSTPDYEQLAAYGKFLLKKLPRPDGNPTLALEDDVELEYFRLQMTSDSGITLAKGEGGSVKAPVSVGTGRGDEELAPLSTIIDILNDKFGTEFTEADKLFFDQIEAEAQTDEQVVAAAKNNPLDLFAKSLPKLFEKLMVKRLDDNGAIVSRYLGDPSFQEFALAVMAKNLYERLNDDGPDDESGPIEYVTDVPS
ncbi:MAG: type I restriction endonuclease [Planctomycetota bacterium]|jgi:type I restriction enzyme R subunit|nr:type I restriction endonuclease [Planctomycetota bacterium]